VTERVARGLVFYPRPRDDASVCTTRRPSYLAVRRLHRVPTPTAGIARATCDPIAQIAKFKLGKFSVTSPKLEFLSRHIMVALSLLLLKN